MPHVRFTENIQRHLPPLTVGSASVREVLEGTSKANPPAHRYVLDDQGALRTHMAIIHRRTVRRRSPPAH